MPDQTTKRGFHIVSPGQAVFALTMIAIGILGLVKGDFGAIWQPVPKTVPARDALIYVCAVVSIGCGFGLMWQRTAALASRVLFLYLLVWLLISKLRFIVLHPLVPISYETFGETAVIVAGAWVLYTWFAASWEKRHLGFVAGETGLWVARRLYGFAMIGFGVAHFAYVEQTAPLVPHYLPSPLAWAYGTGATYILAGVAILSGALARPAAALSALQMAGFTLLVWVPMVAAGKQSAFQSNEFLVSIVLTAAGWVVAESYWRAAKTAS